MTKSHKAVGDADVATIIISVNFQTDYSFASSAFPLKISRTLHVVGGECVYHSRWYTSGMHYDVLCEISGQDIAGQEHGPLFDIIDGGALLLERVILSNFINKDGAGGAISINGGSIEMHNCMFYWNYALASGGAVYNFWGSVEMHGCTFSENYVDAKFGTGGAVGSIGGSVEMHNCTFLRNYAVALGGAIYTDHEMSIGGAVSSNKGSVEMHGCTFSGNYADEGGAVYSPEFNYVEMHNCMFYDNHAVKGGGAVCSRATYEGSVEIHGCMFSGNHAVKGGGAVCSNGGSAEMHGCTFSGNYADGTGGGAVYSTEDSVEMHNCMFSQNHADGTGGGAVSSNKGSVEMHGCTFSGNYASTGNGGVLNSNHGLVWFEQSIMVGNRVKFGGGGSIYLLGGHLHTGFGVIFENNNAKKGSGGALQCGDEAFVQLNNTRIQYNEAEQGAGIHIGHCSVELINGGYIYKNVATNQVSAQLA
ncbi:hypothetical protein CYMTET_48591 [Cymbomonas tetramitiformis]|uniref:Right handed beta helix domain-containing protein n=1 Tax=Cymbomonas tetramitiformis TaxID=36881 RepID=A0AAE0EVL6_9CHLO|nr:hypothetical protein CYMTET_48591 [Cymbomonas tetramitiformis]